MCPKLILPHSDYILVNVTGIIFSHALISFVMVWLRLTLLTFYSFKFVILKPDTGDTQLKWHACCRTQAKSHLTIRHALCQADTVLSGVASSSVFVFIRLVCRLYLSISPRFMSVRNLDQFSLHEYVWRMEMKQFCMQRFVIIIIILFCKFFICCHNTTCEKFYFSSFVRFLIGQRFQFSADLPKCLPHS